MNNAFHVAIACLFGLFWAKIAEYIAVQYFGFPVLSADEWSGIDVAFWTLVVTALILFFTLKLASASRD